jgi:quinoprotein glucose dehydrogenase
MQILSIGAGSRKRPAQMTGRERVLTDSGLTFIAATTDRYFRAFEAQTGKELWRVSLPAAGQSLPMTFRLDSNGKQYVVLSAGGHSALQNKQGDYVIAYALP